MKYILKYVLIPLVVIASLVFLIFHKPIVRYFTFDKTFNKLIENRGRTSNIPDLCGFAKVIELVEISKTA